MNYQDQIKRIKLKLNVAKETDKYLKVFGAASHKYVINKPINEKKIIAFEKTYRVSLPDCYKTFLTQIGNGGCSYFEPPHA